MKLKALFKDDDAVSPVIGVILMVAITVILAAVIASFVLGLGDQNNPAPTADFNFDYQNSSSGSDDLTITHGDGDELDASTVFIRGDGLTGISSTSPPTWANIESGGTVAAGQSTTFNVNWDYTVNVVWEDPDSDSTSTLSTDEGPGA